MKTHENAVIPKPATPGSIGFDVQAIHTHTIQPNSIARIRTGLSTALPSGMYLRIAPRSSLALQHITVEGGVVDGDYRGEITVLMKNNGDKPFDIIPKDKIAQFIFESASSPHIQTVTSLPPSQRNMGGLVAP